MPLPPRKWFTFEQASRKLSEEFKQTVTVSDIVHFLFSGAFLPYIQVKYEINNYILFNNKYKVDLSTFENLFLEDINGALELDYADVKILSDYCNVAVQGIDYPDNYLTKWLEPFVENLLEKMQSEFGELTDETDYIIEKFFTKYQKLTFGIDGLLALKIDCLYNGTPLMSDEFELVAHGLKIKTQDLLTPPIIGAKSGLFFRLKVANEFYIPADELIIVYDDLLRLKNGFRANIQGFAEFADENGNMPNDIPKYFIEWDKRETGEQKTIEKNAQRIEKTNNETPRQYTKKYYKEVVIASCVETFKHYPTAGKNTLVKAVIKELIKNHGVKQIDLQSERTYTNALDNSGITFPDEKGKTIEISKVKIVIP